VTSTNSDIPRRGDRVGDFPSVGVPASPPDFATSTSVPHQPNRVEAFLLMLSWTAFMMALGSLGVAAVVVGKPQIAGVALQSMIFAFATSATVGYLWTNRERHGGEDPFGLLHPWQFGSVEFWLPMISNTRRCWSRSTLAAAWQTLPLRPVTLTVGVALFVAAGAATFATTVTPAWPNPIPYAKPTLNDLTRPAETFSPHPGVVYDSCEPGLVGLDQLASESAAARWKQARVFASGTDPAVFDVNVVVRSGVPVADISFDGGKAKLTLAYTGTWLPCGTIAGANELARPAPGGGN
jgi:hypothetical protein